MLRAFRLGPSQARLIRLATAGKAKQAQRDQYRPATPPKRKDEEEEIEYDNVEYNEYVLESASYFYLKVVGFLAFGGLNVYLVSRFFWTHKNAFGREYASLPNASKAVHRDSIEKSLTLYSKYLAAGKIISPSLQTHQALSLLLQKLVSSAVSLGATELADIAWRIHIIDEPTLKLTILPGRTLHDPPAACS